MENKFWSKVIPSTTDSCWEWCGAKLWSGYGAAIILRNQKFVQIGAHIRAYQLSKGEIPKGLMVLHSCDNPLCCNPSHLRVGTAEENNKERAKRKRSKRRNFNEEDYKELNSYMNDGMKMVDIISKMKQWNPTTIVRKSKALRNYGLAVVIGRLKTSGTMTKRKT